jgi:hypothetical protein
MKNCAGRLPSAPDLSVDRGGEAPTTTEKAREAGEEPKAGDRALAADAAAAV